VNDFFSLIPVVVAGLIVGLVYFAGLWLTVRELTQTQRPMLLTLGSFAGRLSLMLVVLYLVTDGYWVKIALFLLVFFLMRTFFLQRWQLIDSPLSKGGD
jgi:F1F0 ATPase subunit 2